MTPQAHFARHGWLDVIGRRPRPDVSVVVVVYKMAREAPRTLRSLSAAYQRHVAADDYEVIVVDNGSTPPFDRKVLERLPGHFRLIRIDRAPPSPAQAINRGLAAARGEVIGVMIDGARMVTPGLLHFARHGSRLYDRAVVAALTWHLGFDIQGWAIEAGYDKDREDALLAAIDWLNDGYRPLEIAMLAGSSTDGWFLPISESNALFLRRETWDTLGGVDKRFDVPGGGLVNLDTWRRALELPGTEQVILLGEGTFHQLHGGIATNAKPQSLSDASRQWAAQYQAIRGRPWGDPAAEKCTDLSRHSAAARFGTLRTCHRKCGVSQVSSAKRGILARAPIHPAGAPAFVAQVFRHRSSTASTGG